MAFARQKSRGQEMYVQRKEDLRKSTEELSQVRREIEFCIGVKMLMAKPESNQLRALAEKLAADVKNRLVQMPLHTEEGRFNAIRLQGQIDSMNWMFLLPEKTDSRMVALRRQEQVLADKIKVLESEIKTYERKTA